MSEKSPRRWFRFSLRTMFVAVTVFCCWLGWESSVVRARQAMLREFQDNRGFQITTAAAWAEQFPQGTPVQKPATISLMRTWLGDAAVQEIWAYRWLAGFSEADLERLTKAFPEAEVREVLPEPCHPGCFPRETLVDTPHGRRAIEGIQPGDELTSVRKNGELTTAKVQTVFVTDNRLWKLVTEEGELITTEAQPLCLADGRTLPTGKLQPGDGVLVHEEGKTRSVKVLEVTRTSRTERVFNLILGDSEFFVAGGFLARSKPPADAATRQSHAGHGTVP